MFFNILTANDNYSLLSRVNLTQPIQMQLPKKKLFSDFFSAFFVKSRLNFEHFQKKNEPHSLCISEI